MACYKSIDFPLINFLASHKVFDSSCWVEKFTLLIYANYVTVMLLRNILRQLPLLLFDFELLLSIWLLSTLA